MNGVYAETQLLQGCRPQEIESLFFTEKYLRAGPASFHMDYYEANRQRGFSAISEDDLAFIKRLDPQGGEERSR